MQQNETDSTESILATMKTLAPPLPASLSSEADPTLIATPSAPSGKFCSLFFPALFNSEYQGAKYTSNKYRTTSGQLVSCEWRDLKPIDILLDSYDSVEIKNANPTTYQHYYSYLNPVQFITSAASRLVNWCQGIKVQADSMPPASAPEALKAMAYNIYQTSLGQETDMESHYAKYQALIKLHPDPDYKIILFGPSRGAATTINAFAKYKYDNVHLVILEGCFSSVEEVIANWVPSHTASQLLGRALGMFTQYHNDGPSPAKSVLSFPENIPVVFITSKKDRIVPCASTEKLAYELNAKGKNDVYLLKLENANHVNYMFSNKKDHDTYECFIHAIYEKYGVPYKPELAKLGKPLLESCLLQHPEHHDQNRYNMCTVI
ncbi:MAG: hypothetical protein H0W64_02560 [Gammaproteobacteria bacterium]|nr:hypothetical protein [Gammaproteobacteria bacterium]